MVRIIIISSVFCLQGSEFRVLCSELSVQFEFWVLCLDFYFHIFPVLRLLLTLFVYFLPFTSYFLLFTFYRLPFTVYSTPYPLPLTLCSALSALCPHFTIIIIPSTIITTAYQYFILFSEWSVLVFVSSPGPIMAPVADPAVRK